MMNRISELWCGLMHAAAMWPIHGHYECRTCGRRYPVDWERNSRLTTAERSVTWTPVSASR
jgi:hypothetical protein